MNYKIPAGHIRAWPVHTNRAKMRERVLMCWSYGKSMKEFLNRHRYENG
jgi:hypothetical protein